MSNGTKMLITDAGLAEVVNAEASGTAPVVLSHIAFGTGQYTATANMTALKSEFKRFDSIKGGAIGDNVIHLSIHDNSTDTYTVYEVGVFTESGTLFGVYSKTTPIVQKAEDAEVMLVIDITLSDINPESVTVGDTNFILNPATTTTKGIVELATESEAKAGTDATKAITPATLDATIEAHDNVMHRTGSETITGPKTFTSKILFSSTSGGICQDNDSMAMAVYGGTGYQNGASVYLYGKDSTANAGSFIINANDGTNKSVFFCKPDGTASWNNKNIVRSVNNTNADSAGNVSITSVASATKATQDGNGNVIADTYATKSYVDTEKANYLPLAGGKMTGGIYSASSNEYMLVTGGEDVNSGGYIRLDSKDHADTPGSVRLVANDGTNTKALRIDPDGTFTYEDNDIITAQGGVYTKSSAVSRDVDNSFVGIYGGTVPANGATVELCGKDHENYSGELRLYARNGESSVLLNGKPDGTLTWNGDRVICDNKITNCITEIPQDIKLELVDGTLTLKAGSKVYVPNGFEADGTTKKFDEVVISSDLINSTTTSVSGKGIIFYNTISKTLFFKWDNQVHSGTSDITDQTVYRTDLNKISETSAYGRSFPLGIITVTSGAISSIDQVFNGFGYIGSTVFALPNVKGLIPNGRNEDGSLKNIEVTIDKVVIRTSAGASDLFMINRTGGLEWTNDAFHITSSLPTASSSYERCFVVPENQMYYHSAGSTVWEKTYYIIAGDMSKALNENITSLTPKQTFKAIDYSDKPEISGWGMPSDKYVDLTLGASGSTYTAPANGYVHLSKKSTASVQYVQVITSERAEVQNSSSSGQALTLNFPIIKGETFKVSYTAGGDITAFRFVYAEGEN